jgi:oligopeptide/dipeptide ABC transporter ATP-binding protein
MDLVQATPAQIRQIRGNQISMIFQEPMTSLNPVYTVGNQIAETYITHRGLDKKESMDRAVEMLRIVGIPVPEKRVHEYPHQLSGGMRQRAMIAMAMACRPKLLIADEPTTALDVTIQAQIIDLVRRLQQQLGMAVIWITHDLGVVARLAERVIVMYAGYIVEEADIVELYASPRHPYTIGLLGSLPRLDDAPGTQLYSIPGQPPDLVALPKGCPFQPRCDFATERCLEENPSLEQVGPGHQVACWENGRTQGV